MRYIQIYIHITFVAGGETRSSADADNALDANEAVPNK